MAIALAKKPSENPHYKLPALAIQLSDKGAPDLIQVFVCGEFEREDLGKFEITPELLAKCVENFSRAPLHLAVDYAHEPYKKAAAWIKDIFLTGEGDDTQVWARVGWTPTGKTSVEDGDFRYTSADFTAQVDTETGGWVDLKLNGIGLTNRPFLTGMAPIIQLHAAPGPTEDNDMTLDEAKKQIEKLEAKNVKLSEEVKAKDVDAKTLEEAAELKAAEAAAQVEAKDLEISELKKKTAQATIKLAQDQKTAAFDALLLEGKACEAQRVPFMSGDTIQFAKLSEPVKLKAVGTGEPPAPAPGDLTADAAQKEISKQAHVLFAEKKVKSFSEGLVQVIREKKDLAVKYYAATSVRG